MESKNELKEIGIKIVRVIILMIQLKLQILNLMIFYQTKKLYKDNYNILHKTSMGAKQLHIVGVMKYMDVLKLKIKYLVLFDSGQFDKIGDKIKHLICKKVALQIVLIIILQESELIHIILYLQKKY